MATKKQTTTLLTRKSSAKIIATVLRTPLGANLAKQIGRGPLYQDKLDTSADSTTKPLRDYFESLVADEMTLDETFLNEFCQMHY